MRRIGIILVFCTLWATDGFAASRTLSTPASTRAGATTQRVRTQTTTSRKAVRVATPKTKTVSRSAVTPTNSRSVGNRTTNARSAVVARAATTETRTGAEYEQCKAAYFSCMDQFCQLKNDEYRRCSCNDRILSLQSARDKLQQASEQLTTFNENLDIVGKTAAQATAMNTASDGELALTKDNSASKALLTAIMNSIRGTDSRVENNQLSSLNSVDLSFDTTNSLGTMDVGQTIASYNGQALYSAVYPQCRTAVKSSCNDASLQRAVNAYLMAIEQDCNTVQTAIENKQKETHAAIRESSSMLDMARAENHKAHNSDDAATCLANIETAILSEEVCGKNYHKCLDNGEYIDVTTGAPISGVVDFYKLGTLLTFNSERNNEDQRLAQNSKNKMFVTNFEKRVKQFAEPALDKCVDDADTVWTDYLNKAMLDIYYAQQSKVNEIKQGCFDFVSACYMNSDTAMTNAMQGLIAAQTTTLNPNVITLNKSLCSDYIASCNNMFDGNIVNEYIDKRQNTDVLTACRAVVKQCFDNYGGTNYENFYYPSSGLFSTGYAPDWFALYEIDNQNNKVLKSECAKQLATIDSCSDPDMIEAAFGGFDYYPDASNIYGRYAYQRAGTQSAQKRLLRPTGVATEVYNQIIDILQTQCSTLNGKFMNIQNLDLYSNNYSSTDFCTAIFSSNSSDYKNFYKPYSIGKTPQTCNYILSSALPVGRGDTGTSSTIWTDIFTPVIQGSGEGETAMFEGFSGGGGGSGLSCSTENEIYEDMCPRNYRNTVDTSSWGACLCWENGGRRSNNGTSSRCVASFPVRPLSVYDINITESDNNGTATYSYTSKQHQLHGLNYSCTASFATSQPDPNTYELTYGSFEKWPVMVESSSDIPTEQDWCDATNNVNTKNQVCPFGTTTDEDGECNDCAEGWELQGTGNNTKCCPSNYTYTGGYCCPDGYTARSYFDPNSTSFVFVDDGCCRDTNDNNSAFLTYTSTGLCKYADNSTESPVTPTSPMAKSSSIMTNKFPQGQ